MVKSKKLAKKKASKITMKQHGRSKIVPKGTGKRFTGVASAYKAEELLMRQK
jgi:hypothetical protein